MVKTVALKLSLRSQERVSESVYEEEVAVTVIPAGREGNSLVFNITGEYSD